MSRPFNPASATSFSQFIAASPKCFAPETGQWTEATNADNGQDVMTLSGQAITGDMVEGVLSALRFFDADRIDCHPLHQTFGDSVFVARGTAKAPGNVRSLVQQAAQQWQIDIAVQSGQPTLTEPGLLVMDMDSTLIAMECIDEIARLGGVGEEVSAVTLKAMRGELDFKASLIQRVSCLKGIEEKTLASLRKRIPLMPGVALLIQTLKLHNWKVVLASGGFTYFADPLKERLGLDLAVSNTLGVEGGRLTGEVVGDIVDAQRKAQIVEQQAKAWDIPHRQTIAMGDGANDLLMMSKARLGVACHAKPKVNEQADVAILNSGLHSVLYLLAS